MTPELEKVCKKAREEDYYCMCNETFDNGFQAAIESEQVKGLVEALEAISCDDFKNPNQELIGCKAVARVALKKFRGEK